MALDAAVPDLARCADLAIRWVREAPLIAYDTETSGLDWKREWPIGYVVTVDREVAGDDITSVYVPVRHGGGGNLLDAEVPPLTSTTGRFVQHRFERELAAAFKERARRGFLTVGHNLKFDVHFSARAGVHLLDPMECTQTNAALLDEHAGRFGLSACAMRHHLTPKKGDILYVHLSRLFSGPPTQKQMGNFWRLAGTDAVGWDYAAGDGITTLELWHHQIQTRDAQPFDMSQVWKLESELIRVVSRLERRGIRVDLGRAQEVGDLLQADVAFLQDMLPPGFNVRSPSQVRAYCESLGKTDWPMTAPSGRFPNGQPSFTEKWLDTFPEGKRIVEIREATNLGNSFLNPLIERHVFQGRVFPQLHATAQDEFGTISGRFSCSDPNMQQVPKHNKKLGKLFRSIFVPDPDMVLYEGDYSQCLVAGTQVAVPGGTKSIEDMRPGDLVYSYDAQRRLVIRRVTWAGQTGVRPVVRVHWRTNGRTSGHLDMTADHPIRLVDGSYRTPSEIAAASDRGKGQHPYWVPVLALRRSVHVLPEGYKAPFLYSTGRTRVKESRFVFEEVNGWAPEEVHHRDGDPLNNDPSNLEGLTSATHRAKHPAFGVGRMTAEERRAASQRATDGLRRKFRLVNNHAIVRIVPLPDVQAVFDITVEDTHNFIANEICVHNCEPRLFAHYTQEASLIAGYCSTPPRDMHRVCADLMSVDRDTIAKRMNMGLLTGMQPKTFAAHMGWDLSRAQAMFNTWMRTFPGIPEFQQRAKQAMVQRGWVRTLLGRVCRLDDARFAYKAVSRIIQGGNADIVKRKLVDADHWLESEGDVAHVLMTIHDSFLWQAPRGEVGERVLAELRRILVDVQSPPFSLRVPFKLDVGGGDNWAEATYGGKQ